MASASAALVRPRRWLRWLLLGVAVVVSLPVLVWLAFRAFNVDEPLLPEAAKVIEVPEPTFDPDNAYLGMLGSLRGVLPADPYACVQAAGQDSLHPFTGARPVIDVERGRLVHPIDTERGARNPTIDFRFDLAGVGK